MKTAQAAAYLLYKSGGSMKHLKLMKLLYLADRLSWQERDYAITGDEYYSLPYGPVLSKTLDLMHGETFNQLNSANANVWDKWIADDANYCVKLAKKGSRKKIELKTLLTHIGKTPQEIDYIFEDLELKASFSRVLKEA